MPAILALLQAEGFRIFLASPGDLGDFRRAARDEFEHIRLTIASPRGIDFDPIGWEDIPPGFGRPQSLINPTLDECNVLIGILGKQLGTPTGDADSGFVEEYERMAARSRNGEDVAICVYTSELTPDDLADPGDKLKAVLGFRERLLREALVREFHNLEDFRLRLHRDLVSLVLDADDRRRNQSQTAAAPAEAARPEPKREPSDEAGRQLHELMALAAAEAPFAPEAFREDRFAFARLGLWLSTWDAWHFTSETYGIHQLNRVYAMRAQVVLSSMERRHVLRSMCAHRPVAPGWGLLGDNTASAIPELLVLATGDANDEVRSGAFEMLDAKSISDWLARDDVELDRQRMFGHFRGQVVSLSDSVRDAMIAFTARMGGGEASAFLVELSHHDPSTQKALEALIRIAAAERSRQAFELAAGFDASLGDETLVMVRSAASEADLADLQLLESASDERLRILATELLAARGRLAVPILVALLDDVADDVALAAFGSLSAIADSGVDLRLAYDKLRDRENLKFDDELRSMFDRTQSTAALLDSVDWLDISTASSYRVLAEERWDEFRDTVRRDLADRFSAFAEASREQFTAGLGPEVVEVLQGSSAGLATISDGIVKPVEAETLKRIVDFLAGSEWNDRRFAVAALNGIAHNGEPEDAPLVRPWLDAEYAGVREAAAAALERVGSESDVSKLLELSHPYSGDAFARAALALSPGPQGASLDLLRSSRAAAALAGARHLYSHATELSDETLEALLRHTSEEVRRVGVACAMARDDAALEHLLDAYTNARSYYYNVVWYLDRVLFGLGYLQEETRADLKMFAAEQPTSNTGRASGRLAALLRSHVSA